MLVGSWFWGTISDYIGRRTGFQLTVLIFAVFGLLSAFAPGWEWLAALRFLTGFGLGGALPLDFSLYCRVSAEQRPGAQSRHARELLGRRHDLGRGARAAPRAELRLAAAARDLRGSGAPGALDPAPRPRVPALPGDLWFAAANGRPAPELEPVSGERRAGATVAGLWRPGLRRSTLTLWIAWFCVALAYYGIFAWLLTTLAEQGFSSLRTYGTTFVLALAQLPGYLSAAYLVEPWSRRNTLGLYLLASGAFTFLFAAASGPGWIIAAAVPMSFFSLGAWAALYAWTPEIYPTEIRATGMGWASGMARIAGILSPILGGALISFAATSTGSLPLALSLWAAAFAIGGLAVFLLGVETRRRALLDTVSDPQTTP